MRIRKRASEERVTADAPDPLRQFMVKAFGRHECRTRFSKDFVVASVDLEIDEVSDELARAGRSGGCQFRSQRVIPGKLFRTISRALCNLDSMCSTPNRRSGVTPIGDCVARPCVPHATADWMKSPRHP